MTPIRIVICDDHPIFRAGLQGLLSAQDGFEVVGEAANGKEAVSVVRHASPDLLLIDLQMPELDGVGAIREIREIAPATWILGIDHLRQRRRYPARSRGRRHGLPPEGHSLRGAVPGDPGHCPG